MNRMIRWGFALALLPLAACSSNQPAPVATAPAPAPMPMPGPADQAFVAAAANSDMTEIQTSQIALQKARRPAVRAYAQQMIDHHTQTSQQLSPVAQAKGITVPSTLTPQSQQLVETLNRTPAGPRFDRAYLRGQVMSHQMTVQQLQTYINSGTDSDLKTVATNELPIVQQHLTEAQRLSGGTTTAAATRPARHGAHAAH